MDNSISDDELAALGLSLEDFFSSPPAPPPVPFADTPQAAEPTPPAQKGLSQAEIDALLASLNL